ncbi:MAG: efflux RND transporter periplasmic adaptor subunit [Roseimicrobium sp.]
MNADKITLDGLRIDRTTAPVKPRTNWTLPVTLVLAAVGIGFWWQNRPQATVVEVATAREQVTSEQQTLLNASGYVAARRETTVSSKVTGKVEQLLIEEGMKVEAGQELARLDARNIHASLRLAEAQLESARMAKTETEPGLVYARQELKRFTELMASKAASVSDLNKADADVKALEAKLKRQAADISVAERDVDQWKQQLDDMTIRAPFTGIVTTKNAQPGEMISPMSAGGFTRTGVCTLVDMTSLEIEVDVNESYINRVQPGQPVEATLDAYADWHIPAKVIAIIPTADRQKATVKVRIAFEQLDPRILPDMAVKVAFQRAHVAEQDPARGKVTIPTSALQQSNGRDVVWVLREGTLERRAVTVQQKTGPDAILTAGLSHGERVVINASPALREGLTVIVKKP